MPAVPGRVGAVMADKTTVVNLRDVVRIDRRTKWGNPFIIGKDGNRNREEVIAMYREWIHKPEQAHLIAALPELKGKKLGCWCAPLACRGDVLVAMVEALGSGEG